MNSKLPLLLLVLAFSAAAGCGPARSAKTTAVQPSGVASVPATQAKPGSDPCIEILKPHAGSNRVDVEVIRWQKEAGAGVDTHRALERLGWAFVAKARESFDDTFYVLAEQCALCLEARQPGAMEALLLRGHALHNRHQFKAAEPLARDLVARRGAPFDHGLLGDVLMEQGRLAEAARAYQEMMDLRPDLQSYARGAHLRWLKGDLKGAADLMQRAARAGSAQDANATAWVYTRLAWLRLQAGAVEPARQACDLALGLQKDYAPALLAKGRVLMAAGRALEAVDLLQRAEGINPLPEYQWTLAEALRAAGLAAEAVVVEQRLERLGALTDPRTFALYLATKGKSPAQAVGLAEQELQQRADVFTHDALAWALTASGRLDEAWLRMQQALAEGTADARLHCHAAVLATRRGLRADARRWIDLATGGLPALLPSEQELLLDTAALVEAGQ